MSIAAQELTAEQALDAMRSARLRRTLAAVAAAHPFYRTRFQALKIDPRAVRSVDDVGMLPLTQKSDYTADPDAFRLRGGDLPAEFSSEERVLWDVAYTTGTTSGKPSPFYNTTHDIYGILDQARRCSETEGLLAGDRIANLYPLANFPTGGFLSVLRSAMIMGLPVVNGLTGAANSEFKVRNALAEAIAIIERARPTVLWGVPSFVRKLLDEARRRGADFSDVRLVITSGEPVPSGLRSEMRQHLAAMGAGEIAIRARYACTEMQGGLVQCCQGAHTQNICPDLYYLEVVDPDTGRALPDGETGMMAVTHLHRRGTVMLRYLLGDLVALSREPCPHCGRLGERVVATPRRTGNLVKCRGMLVNTDVILDVVSAQEGAGEFQVVFQRGDAPGAMDELVIRIERETGEGAAAEALRDTLVQRVRAAVSLRSTIEFVARGTLYDERNIKAKRVIDTRKIAD
jgi:phenylacetate-coenzyme A ligase PaaK-like adenylate-forming protein